MSIVIPFDSRTARREGPDPQFIRLAHQESRVDTHRENTQHFERPITQEMMEMGIPSGRREAKPARELPPSD